jgi:hypothetical protein
MKNFNCMAASAAAVASEAASGAPARKLPVPAYALPPRVRVIHHADAGFKVENFGFTSSCLG